MFENLGYQDEQPDMQGLSMLVSTERCATSSPIGKRLFNFI